MRAPVSLVLVSALVAGGAAADVAVPPADAPLSAIYAPLPPLPDGISTVSWETIGGKQWYDDPDYHPPKPTLPPASFVGMWYRNASTKGGAVRVRVSLEMGPVHVARPPLRAWAAELWPLQSGSRKDFLRHLHAGEVRIWTDGEGRHNSEYRASSSCRECDPIWRVIRLREHAGGALKVEVVVYGHPDAAEQAELRRAFLDGPLGAPK